MPTNRKKENTRSQRGKVGGGGKEREQIPPASEDRQKLILFSQESLEEKERESEKGLGKHLKKKPTLAGKRARGAREREKKQKRRMKIDIYNCHVKGKWCPIRR